MAVKRETFNIGATLYVAGALFACSGEGCRCDGPTATDRPPPTSSTEMQHNQAQSPDTSIEPSLPPVDLYEEEPISIQAEFDRYTAGILACHKRGEKCAREAKIGRKMARRALREVQRGNHERLKSLWQLSMERMAKEPEARLRLEITTMLKLAPGGAPQFQDALLELLENESESMAARNLGGLLVTTLGADDNALKDRLEHYLRRMEPKNKGLIAGQIGAWEGMATLIQSEERWLDTALWCLSRVPDGRLQTMLVRMVSYAPEENRSDTQKRLSSLLRRSRKASQLSLASASVETLGKLGQPSAIEDIEHAIKSRYHQRSFLPSAALALFHLTSRGGPQVDGKRVITSAQRILEIPGLSPVAYRYALYAIRDSGHFGASETLKSYAKHPNKEARKIAVKALLGVGKTKP